MKTLNIKQSKTQTQLLVKDGKEIIASLTAGEKVSRDTIKANIKILLKNYNATPSAEIANYLNGV